jgi:hypothetical protein
VSSLGPNWVPLYVSGHPSSGRYLSFCAISGDINITASRNVKYSMKTKNKIAI